METIEGKRMHGLATRLFPICRSITGNGVRETLKILAEFAPLTTHEVPSGTQVFDWTVPKEWNITAAWIRDSKGNTVVDFAKNNLHIVGYSTPVDARLSLSELQGHLYSLPAQPDAIPYVTSYYKERWGFCMEDGTRAALAEDIYHVFIDSTLSDGSLTYGEALIPGANKKEIFISTYVCHPSMANNELSGPVVAAELARFIASAPRRYTYRIIFVPETIGSLVYLSKNLASLKENVIAGFNLTCMGDERAFSYLPSRDGHTIADRIAQRVLIRRHPDFKSYSFLDRGSDERQYCAPGADLPVASIMRSKYGEYPEYHTSLDDLSFVTPAGLQGSYDVLRECIEEIEGGKRYRPVTVGEPQLGKRNLYPTLSQRGSVGGDTKLLLDILAYSDGMHDLDDLALTLSVSVDIVRAAVDVLVSAELLIAEA